MFIFPEERYLICTFTGFPEDDAVYFVALFEERFLYNQLFGSFCTIAMTEQQFLLFGTWSVYDFVRGPLMWIAFLIFVGGIIFRISQFFSITRKKAAASYPVIKARNGVYGEQSASEQKMQSLVALKTSILGTYPVVTISTTVFHTLLIVTPIFLYAHNALLYESWRVRLFTFSEGSGDALTILFIALAFGFLVRRVAVARVNAISSFSDYFVWFITVAPFITGFFAYHQWFDYSTMLILHILAGELMLVAITFTKLGHMIFFFLARFFVNREYNFGKGARTW